MMLYINFKQILRKGIEVRVLSSGHGLLRYEVRVGNYKVSGILKFLCFLGAISSFPLYLLSYGLRFAPAATQKDAVAIWARIFVVSSIFQILIDHLFVLEGSQLRNSKTLRLLRAQGDNVRLSRITEMSTIRKSLWKDFNNSI